MDATSKIFGAKPKTASSLFNKPAFLAKEIRAGKIQAIARAITLFESSATRVLAQKLLAKIFPYTGSAFLVGITGPSGVGKSSLVDRLVECALEKNPQQKIACLLVDPTNQFTGGSILGDRIRFGQQRVLDNRVFIRSLAAGTRLGGLSHHVREAIAVLEAGGYNLIFIETVGIGQSEIEIVKVAHTVVLACQPASGDSIQMLKSGITEMGHILVVNKADLESLADEMYRTVAASTSPHADGWQPVVLKTSIQESYRKSIVELYGALRRHQKFIDLAQRRRQYLKDWVREIIDREILAIMRRRCPVKNIDPSTSPYETARGIIEKSKIK